jgi:hypothetical protein
VDICGDSLGLFISKMVIMEWEMVKNDIVVQCLGNIKEMGLLDFGNEVKLND